MWRISGAGQVSFLEKTTTFGASQRLDVSGHSSKHCFPTTSTTGGDWNTLKFQLIDKVGLAAAAYFLIKQWVDTVFHQDKRSRNKIWAFIFRQKWSDVLVDEGEERENNENRAGSWNNCKWPNHEKVDVVDGVEYANSSILDEKVKIAMSKLINRITLAHFNYHTDYRNLADREELGAGKGSAWERGACSNRPFLQRGKPWKW